MGFSPPLGDDTCGIVGNTQENLVLYQNQSCGCEARACTNQGANTAGAHWQLSGRPARSPMMQPYSSNKRRRCNTLQSRLCESKPATQNCHFVSYVCTFGLFNTSQDQNIDSKSATGKHLIWTLSSNESIECSIHSVHN